MGFCVDGVCCNRACDRQEESCDGPDRPGICIASTPLPAASAHGLVVLIAALATLGMVALRGVRGTGDATSQ